MRGRELRLPAANQRCACILPDNPSPSHPSQSPRRPRSPRAANRLKNQQQFSLRFLRRWRTHPATQLVVRKRRRFELGLYLLAESPHRRRDCLSEIESRRLRASAQILDLAFEADWDLERNRFAFLPAF